MIASRLTYLLLVLAAVLIALSQFFPLLRNLGLVVDIVLVSFIVIDYQLTLRARFIVAERDIAERLSIGRDNQVVLSILNQGAQSVRCLVKDDSPATLEKDVALFDFVLPALGESRLVYHVKPRRRGAYRFGSINLRYKSKLGLFWRQISLACQKQVKVYSDLKALYDLSIKLSRSSELGELHQRRRGQGTDFASLREYTVGDDVKMIDWKATARRDRPVVRTYEAEQEQRLLILIDAGRMMLSDLEGLTRFDHALNAALCLALTGLSRNDQVGLGIFADKPLLYLPSRRGKAHLKTMLDSTFDVEPRLVEPDYLGMLSYFASAQKGRSLIVVLTDLTDPTGSQSLLSGLASLSPRHLPFCVTLTDRQVIGIATSHLSRSERDAETLNFAIDPLFRRAVAIDLLSQRELALSVLQRRGCLVLDCPPQELSDKIVDKYLEIKTRARL